MDEARFEQLQTGFRHMLFGLAIEAGASLDGKVSPLGGSKIAPRSKDGKKGKGHANDGSELPFTGTNG